MDYLIQLNACSLFGLFLALINNRLIGSYRIQGVFMMHQPTIVTEESINPEWEKELKAVAKERNRGELLFDPFLIEQTYADDKGIDFINALTDSDIEQEKSRQIDLVKRVVHRKLKGFTRYCLLLILMTGAGPKRISQILGIKEDVVARSIKRGTRIIQGCLASEFGEFPTAQGKRPSLRASLFPIDTPKEREQFQDFLNEHTVIHVSYSGEDLFREVLVIYLTGKAAKKQ